MIRSEELAIAVLEEVKALSKSRVYKENPIFSDEQKLARRLEQAPLPSIEHLSFALDNVFKASLLLEEGRPCCPRLLYSDSKELEDNIHALETPIILKAESLRKITPARGSMNYLTWRVDGGISQMTGILVHQLCDPPNLIISVPRAGVIDVSWNYTRIVAYRNGEVKRLSKSVALDSSRLYSVVSKVLESFEPNFLGSIVRKIAKQNHGGALWIMREPVIPSDIDVSYVLKRDPRTLLQRYEGHVSRDYWLRSISNLATVDGAVLLDSRMRVMGFGSFMNTDKSIEVDRYLADGTMECIPSSLLGGGRHRSAVAFCNAHAPAAAVVASADGRVTLITALRDMERPICAEIDPLGFSDSFI